jgi:hypothetical protein
MADVSGWNAEWGRRPEILVGMRGRGGRDMVQEKKGYKREHVTLHFSCLFLVPTAGIKRQKKSSI